MTNKVKVLNNDKPLISNIPRDNFVFTVLSCNKNLLEKFVLEKYILPYSLLVNYKNNLYDYVFRYTDSMNSIFNHKYFKTVIITREMMSVSKINIIDFIKNMINNNYYVYLNIDRYYIKAYKYMKHFSHGLTIYGYDDDKKIFYIKDFFNGMVYSNNICSYSELVSAYEGHLENRLYSIYDGIIGLKINDSLDIKIEINDVINNFKNFLSYKFNEKNEKNYGLGIIESFIYQLYDNTTQYAPFDFIREKLSFIYNYIYIMQKRIEILSTIYNIDFNDLFKGLDEINKKVEIYINLSVKNIITKHVYTLKYYSYIVYFLEEVKIYLKNVFNEIIEKLEEYIKQHYE